MRNGHAVCCVPEAHFVFLCSGGCMHHRNIKLATHVAGHGMQDSQGTAKPAAMLLLMREFGRDPVTSTMQKLMAFQHIDNPKQLPPHIQSMIGFTPGDPVPAQAAFLQYKAHQQAVANSNAAQA